MKYDMLIEAAVKIKNNSYSPYSKFKVGAALITKNNKLFTGTNIENVSYGATVCAERVAIFNAISQGEKLIKEIAITSDLVDYIYPCGICRQVIGEFANKDTVIICCRSDFSYKVYSIEDLIPKNFSLK